MKKSALKVKNLKSLIKDFKLDESESTQFVLDVAKDLWENINTPTSLGLYLCVTHGDLRETLKHTIEPHWYLSSESFGLDYQAVSFLKKAPFSIIPKEERIASATEKFWIAEHECSKTNQRFRNRYRGVVSTAPVEAVLFAAQRKISSWLGDGPSPSRWLARCRFGPGADDSTSGPRVGAFHKLSSLSATADFADGAVSMALDHPPWMRYLCNLDDDDLFENEPVIVTDVSINIASGNKVVFVPKTAMIERSIAVEPRMNVFAQLGLGSLIRDALKHRAGLDLDDQSVNQDLAWYGSKFGGLATIDLTQASDMLARELVRDLLPDGWFTALDWCRSKQGCLNDTLFSYEKFSSMGNGFTFELESMIYYALALSCCEHLGYCNWYTRAYGDDIICPSGAVALLEEVLTYCGFTVNVQKSFSSGCFRESCGADFFDGTNVRPFFLKEIPSDVTSLFGLANGIRRAALRSGRYFYSDRRFRAAWLRTVRRLPKPLRSITLPVSEVRRLWGIELNAGDGGLILDQDGVLSSPHVRKARDWIEGWYIRTITARAWTERRTDYPPRLYLLNSLYCVRDGLPPDHIPGVVPGRGSVGKRLTSRVLTRELYSAQPWL